MHHRGGSVALLIVCGLLSFPKLLLLLFIWAVFPAVFWGGVFAFVVVIAACMMFKKFSWM